MLLKFKATLNNHQEFENKINELIKYGTDIIFDDKMPQDVQILLIESLLLRSCAYWEKFIETEIIETINLNYKKFLTNVELPVKTKLNKKLIRAIIFSNSYLDFHHVDQIVSYFKENMDTKINPFKTLSTENKNKIDFTYKIRNYISHYSDFSRKKLLAEMKKRNLCKTRFIEPGLLLIKNKGEIFHDIINNFVNCSLKMKKNFNR